jgi:GDP-4-dehydro-6-deoxy-D-mannose reductase
LRVLITGVTGFAGRFLADYLRSQQGTELHGITRSSIEIPHVQLHQADLLDPDALRSILWLVQPVQIYHLAAYTDAGGSFRDARRVWDANLTATLNLYDACLSELSHRPRILYVSSGAVYGEAEDQPITERTPLRPNSPYAASKAAADLASFQYWVADRLAILRVRPFNQVGPGQSTNFALARFAQQLVRIERGEAEPVLRVGNLGAERDFTDVRDMIQAFALLMASGEPGEVYNAASGTSHTMQRYLDHLLAHLKLPVTLETDPKLLRPVEAQRLQVDISKLRLATDWSPSISLDQSLLDLFSATRRAGAHT